MIEGTLLIQIITLYLVLIVIIAPLWAMIDRNLQNAQILETGREANRSLSALTDMMSMTNTFIFYLQNGKDIIFPNRFFEITHIRKRPIHLWSILRCMSKEDKEKCLSAINNKNPEGMTVTCNISFPTKGIKHSINLTINNVMDEDGENTCIGLFMLIDDIKNTERHRHEAIKMEEDSNIKSSFLASMGHEIRTPLNAIVGFSQIITSQYEYLSDDDRKGFFDIIKQNNDQLLVLLDSLSNPDNDNLKIVLSKKKVSDLMEEIYLSHTVIVEKPLQLVYSRGSNDDYVMINRVAMIQVMSNLMNNAIKFTKKKQAAEGTITLGWESDDEHIIFFVEDTGIGIKEENIEKIFDKGVKLDGGQTRGAGLGLPHCKRLVTKMNGTIQAKSTYGKGSRFEVVFDKVKS